MNAQQCAVLTRAWRAWGWLMASVAIAGCGAETPSAPPPVPPGFMISDAVHSGGKPHFFFLPPMVQAPAPTGTFDPALAPEVQVCRMAGAECEETVAIFTATTDWGSERVRVSLEDEHYIVNWHTDETGLDPGKTYRIRILAGGVELGFADVEVAESARELRNVNTDEYVPLVDGRTLPIKFRVEEGFLASIAVAPEEATIEVGQTQAFVATLTDLHGNELTGITVNWSTTDEAVATVNQSGLATGVAEGGATISATAAGVEGSAQLTVFVPQPEPGLVTPEIDFSQWSEAVATDVNDQGVVVGYLRMAAGGQRRPFRWDGVNPVEVLPIDGATACEAHGVGNLGTIVGQCTYPSGGGTLGVTWTGTGNPVPLPKPIALNASNARDIYEDATVMRITGMVFSNYNYRCSSPSGLCTSEATNPAIWTSTNGLPPTDLPVPLGWGGNANGASGQGMAINASGHATGLRSVVVRYVCGFQCFNLVDVPHAFRYNGTGAGDLGVMWIPPYGDGKSGGLGINSAGVIVGWVESNANRRHWAVRWSGGATTRLTIPGVPAPTASASEAHDVNDLGWIVGLHGANAFVWKNGADPAEVLEPLAPGKVARAYAISNVNDGRLYAAGSAVNADGKTVPVRWTLVTP